MLAPIIQVWDGESVVVEVRNLDRVGVPRIQVGNARSPRVAPGVGSGRTWCGGSWRGSIERVIIPHRARISTPGTSWGIALQSKSLLRFVLCLNLR